MSADGLAQAAAKMRAAGQPEGAVRAFSQRATSACGRERSFMLASADLEPLEGVPTLEAAPDAAAPRMRSPASRS